MTRAVVALGSNLGESVGLIDAARRALDASPGTWVVGVSPMYSSLAHTPEGVADSERYVNAVAIVETDAQPLELLHLLQAIEVELGRPREHGHWMPRTIDLDLVTLGDVVMDSAELTLPHPRAHERVFVLQPWSDLDEHAQLAGEPIANLLGRCSAEERAALIQLEVGE
ncbi:MAG TPA: 2-amino-4-hydroxy-6-hydroxymethyldihydropteridine diphosphokinase [Microbacteriaceae bacterium]|nr:2-amino-4-hydroxy-6-hydroxymethyldihydropteridine diphosphokinase [Microbacteriaceae bacterium]